MYLIGGSLHAGEKVLCADVGNTRIKAAVLDMDLSLEELRAAAVIAFDSKEWWSERLPHLFNPTIPGSLPQRLQIPYQKISFGMCGPVADGGIYLNCTRPIPKNLKGACESIANIPVAVVNDAVMWVKGALVWNRLIGQEIQYPSLGITLGTGVGAVLLITPEHWIALEVSHIGCPFERIHAIAQEQPLPIGNRFYHRLVGKYFFEWAAQAHPEWSDSELQHHFVERAAAFLEDMRIYINQGMGIALKSVMIGGGNSRLIDKEALSPFLDMQIALYNSKSIEPYGVSSDIISLLGGIDSTPGRFIAMMPEAERLTEILNEELAESNNYSKSF